MEFFVSQILCLATHITPKGFMKCEGQTLETADYPALFSVIGITYGGNGTTNFKLPDIRDRSIMHQSASKLLGSTGGKSSVALDNDNLPEHSHGIGDLKVSINVVSGSTSLKTPTGKFLGAITGTANIYSEADPDSTLNENSTTISGNTGKTGLAEPVSVDIQNPYIAMNYFISLYGVLPVSE